VSLTDLLLSYALTYFDVAGTHQISNTESALIIGLESTPQRNLDEFRKIGKKFYMPGFATYVQPGLELILNRI
jgi:hypothetical protein